MHHVDACVLEDPALQKKAAHHSLRPRVFFIDSGGSFSNYVSRFVHTSTVCKTIKQATEPCVIMAANTGAERRGDGLHLNCWTPLSAQMVDNPLASVSWRHEGYMESRRATVHNRNAKLSPNANYKFNSFCKRTLRATICRCG